MRELADMAIEQLETLGDMAIWDGLLDVAKACYEKAQALRGEVTHEQSGDVVWTSELAV